MYAQTLVKVSFPHVTVMLPGKLEAAPKRGRCATQGDVRTVSCFVRGMAMSRAGSLQNAPPAVLYV